MSDKEKDKAIEGLSNACEDYKDSITALQEENKFLTDTIEKNNLGQIANERRNLLDYIAEKEYELKEEKKELHKAKQFYEDKIAEISAKEEYLGWGCFTKLDKKAIGTEMYNHHELEVIHDAYICTGRVLEAHDGVIRLRSVFLIPIYYEYMLGANIGLYTDMFEHDIKDIVWFKDRCFCRLKHGGFMPVINPECCDISGDPFNIRVGEHEAVYQPTDDQYKILITQIFAAVMRRGEWWHKADEESNVDLWSLEGWDSLHKIVELRDVPLSNGVKELLRYPDKYKESWFRDGYYGRDYVEALNDVGLDGDRLIKVIFNPDRIGFLNCDVDGKSFRNYFDPSFLNMPT